ncbi:MAG: cupin domain-containing protein [Treponema sp.]|jgi:transcriptional regulator with XRE-family HTH domain|nr:cupin domain-containing protein [Treponema sp.]
MASTHTPGERIVELCKTYSVSRETLAERSGLPLDLIRNIEEAGHIPDLAPLIKIARALGVRLGTLLDDHEELGPVITRAGQAAAAARFVTGLPAESSAPEGNTGRADASGDGQAHEGIIFNALAADKGGRHMEPFIVDIEPNAAQEKSTHEGEEFIHILSGTLSLEYGTASHVLYAGDSVYYDSIVPHRVLSANKEPVRILAVIYTPA